MFETRCNFAATKIASSCWNKNRLCKRDLILARGRGSTDRAKQRHYLFLEAHSFVRFSEQIMSADKYPSIFSRLVKAIVYLYQN